MKKQEIDDVFDEHKEIYLFATDLRPNSTLQVTWTRNASQVTCRVTKSFVEYYRFDSLMTGYNFYINYLM